MLAPTLVVVVAAADTVTQRVALFTAKMLLVMYQALLPSCRSNSAHLECARLVQKRETIFRMNQAGSHKTDFSRVLRV